MIRLLAAKGCLWHGQPIVIPGTPWSKVCRCGQRSAPGAPNVDFWTFLEQFRSSAIDGSLFDTIDIY